MFKGVKRFISKVSRVIATLLYVVMIALIVWVALSILEVMYHNMFALNGAYEYCEFNLFSLMLS
jgi:hypothetical protein